MNRLFRRTMSVHVAPRRKVTIATLHAQRRAGTPITMITAYDYPTALTLSNCPTPVDITLVGDSLAQVALGLPSTTSLTLPEMIHHARAVARGTTHPLLVADMPFGSYHTSVEDAARNAVRLIQEGRVDALKIEGGREVTDIVKKFTSMGISVMAHVGLLPQRYIAMSGYKVQGKDLDGAEKVWRDALALQDAGAFAIVLEAVPKELARFITEKLHVPTIGIGAGPWTDGQVLVWDDMMNTAPSSMHKPKFVRRFADIRSVRDQAIADYSKAVKDRSFPHEVDESYRADESVWEAFLERRKAEGM